MRRGALIQGVCAGAIRIADIRADKGHQTRERLALGAGREGHAALLTDLLTKGGFVFGPLRTDFREWVLHRVVLIKVGPRRNKAAVGIIGDA